MSKIRWVGYVLTGIFAVGAVTAFTWKPAPPVRYRGLSELQVPMIIGQYQGVRVAVDPATKVALSSADIIERQFTGPDGGPISVTIIGGTGRSQLHDPRSCMLGAGWQIENDRVERLPGTAGFVPVRSCQVSVPVTSNLGSSSQQDSTDIIYLYVLDDKIVASASDIRWQLLKSDLLEQTDEPVYYIRTMMAMPAPQDGGAARLAEHHQLEQFTAALWSAVRPVIEQGERQ
jgi:hypothetical protein